jgi:hypothetical protein
VIQRVQGLQDHLVILHLEDQAALIEEPLGQVNREQRPRQDSADPRIDLVVIGDRSRQHNNLLAVKGSPVEKILIGRAHSRVIDVVEFI